jgi:hypothetical protein
MPDFKTSKIYKITNNIDECYYVGTTVRPLEHVLKTLKQEYKNYQKEKKLGAYLSLFDLFDKYGVDNCEIKLIKNFECNSKKELYNESTKYIVSINCINKNHPEIKKIKELKESKELNLIPIPINKSTYTDKRREYYNNNKTNILEKQKKYDSEHIKQIRESRKQSQYTCSCGSVIQKSNLPQHNKSKKHLKYKMENEKPDFWDQF